jgi:hypothetical protein
MATSLAVSAELQFLFEEIGSRRFSVGATPWLLLTAFLSSSLTWEIDGGDDGSFIRAGLPSFGFLQNPLDYNTRTHHTSSDVYERIPPDDARFNSAFVAYFLWCAAQREGKFPR